MHQEGGCFLSLRISPHLFKVFIYLSHYSAPVASLTLQRNSYVVYLSRSDASPNSFTFLFLCSRSLRTKIVLNSLRFSIPFFFPICFYSFINSPQSWQLKLYVPMLPLFPSHGFLHSPSWQLKAHHTPVSVVDIPSGSWLDRPVTTPLARETDINISPLCCSSSSVEGHDEAARRGRGWG